MCISLHGLHVCNSLHHDVQYQILLIKVIYSYTMHVYLSMTALNVHSVQNIDILKKHTCQALSQHIEVHTYTNAHIHVHTYLPVTLACTSPKARVNVCMRYVDALHACARKHASVSRNEKLSPKKTT
jgi:hypothetical protein